MSAETDSNIELVYVRLLGEGTVVYRPAPAWILGSDVAVLRAPDDYDPNDEKWEFKPGTTVRFEHRSLEGSSVRVAISPAD